MKRKTPDEHRLIGKLFPGPIDIIGDVHGECGALCALLDRLGYDGNGHHPDGRRLVFVGDLVDRGPDSPGVVRLVRHLVAKENAQCILGNHELNILRGQRKHGNHWVYGEPEVIRKDKGGVSFQVLADEAFRSEALEFFASLPLVLEREDMVVVHAALDVESMDRLRDFNGGVLEALTSFEKKIMTNIADGGIDDPDEIELLKQNHNPVKVLTSGLEGRAPEPYFSGGKMRNTDRLKWWEQYEPQDGKLVVIGHYWRKFSSEVDPRVREKHPDGFKPNGEDAFPGYSPWSLLGPAKKVMCVDFSAGVRYEERGMGLPDAALGTQMGALRHPDMTLHFSDSRVIECK